MKVSFDFPISPKCAKRTIYIFKDNQLITEENYNPATIYEVEPGHKIDVCVVDHNDVDDRIENRISFTPPHFPKEVIHG